MMKSLLQCQSEVAIKHRLGKSLVIGHKPAYYNEATEMYVAQFYSEEEVKLLTATAYGNGRGNMSTLWSDWWAEMKKGKFLKEI